MPSLFSRRKETEIKDEGGLPRYLCGSAQLRVVRGYDTTRCVLASIMAYAGSDRLPILPETVYAAAPGNVGASRVLFWPAVYFSARTMAHSRFTTMEVIMPNPVQISLRIPGTALI